MHSASPQAQFLASIGALVLVAGHLRLRCKNGAPFQPSGLGLDGLQYNGTGRSSASAGAALRAPAGFTALPTPHLAQSRARHRARHLPSGAGSRSPLRAGEGSGSCHMSGTSGGSHHMADTGGAPRRAGGGSTSASVRRQGAWLQLWCSKVAMLPVAHGCFCCGICRWKQGKHQLSKPWHKDMLSVVWVRKLVAD